MPVDPTADQTVPNGSTTTPGSQPSTAAEGCPLVLYVSSATIHLDLTSSFESMRSATVTMCLDDACSAAVFDLTGPLSPGASAVATSGSKPLANGWFAATLVDTSAGSLQLDAQWLAGSPADLRDGDVYTLQGKSNDGTVLFDLTQVVDHYTVETGGQGACEWSRKTFSITRGQ